MRARGRCSAPRCVRRRPHHRHRLPRHRCRLPRPSAFADPDGAQLRPAARRRHRDCLRTCLRRRLRCAEPACRGGSVGCPERAASCFSPERNLGQPPTLQAKNPARGGTPGAAAPPATRPRCSADVSAAGTRGRAGSRCHRLGARDSDSDSDGYSGVGAAERRCGPGTQRAAGRDGGLRGAGRQGQCSGSDRSRDDPVDGRFQAQGAGGWRFLRGERQLQGGGNLPGAGAVGLRYRRRLDGRGRTVLTRGSIRAALGQIPAYDLRQVATVDPETGLPGGDGAAWVRDPGAVVGRPAGADRQDSRRDRDAR